MPLFFRIQAGTTTIVSERQLPDGTEYNDAATSLINGKDFLAPVVITNPSFDPQTEIKEGPVDNYDGTTATRIFTVRPKTQQELDDDGKNKDTGYVLSATKDIGIVLTALIDTLLAQNIITAQDVEPIARQAYQNLKTRVDRIKGT